MTQTGVYVGNDPSDLSTYEQWLGQDVDNVLFYLNQSSWQAFDSSIAWAVDLWKPTQTPVLWSVPLVVTGSTLQQAAAGDFDAHYLQAAKALAASEPAGTGAIYVRVGWEFNGTWEPWSAQGQEAAFIAAYQDLVTVFRSVSNNFKFVWDTNLGGSYNPALAYPGDNYVDVVGTDVYYNTQYDSADPNVAFQTKVTEAYGLQWQQDFAAEHGKPTAISEWGVESDNAGPYIQDVANWLASHNMLYENYWETNAAGFNGELHNGQDPDAGIAFKQAFVANNPVFTSDQTDATVQVVLHQGASISFQGNHILAESFQLASDQTVVVGDGQAETLAGIIVDGSATTPSLLEKAGAGILNLAAENTFSGGIALHAGELVLTALGAAGTGAITFDAANSERLAVTPGAFQAGAAHELVNTINGFAAGDSIDLVGLGGGVSTIVDAAHGLYSVQDGSGTTLATFHLTGDYTAQTFTTTSDGAGGTMLTVGPTPAASDSLTLRVSEDAYQGDAQFIVKVDGQQFGGLHTVTASHAAGQYQDVVLDGLPDANLNMVQVQFVNDAYGGVAALDRNLYVDQMVMNGHTYGGASGSNAAGVSAGAAAGLYWDGTLSFDTGSQQNSLTLKVAEDAYQGDAQFTVMVDGKQIGGVQTATASYAAGLSQDITLSGAFGVHPQNVTINFINDLYGGSSSTDRNLHVEALSIDGETFAGAAGHNAAGLNNNGVAHLYFNGSLSFQVHDIV